MSSSAPCPRCGFDHSTAPPPGAPGAITLPPAEEGIPDTQGARLARFQVERLIGSGSFGVVYRAFDTVLRRAVALKIARPEMEQSPGRVERFLREARAASVLMHPHIVPVFDSGREGGKHYLASAFIDGQPLDAALEAIPEGQGLPLRQAATIARALAEALAYAHRQGVIHRDVKPSNVLLTADGEPMLADFGLAARADEERMTQAGQVLGTPAYMAPEQWQGKAEAASDQYSLGAVLYELLTGRPPFEASDGDIAHYAYLHSAEAAKPPAALRPEVPRDLATIVLKCLEKEPGRRYADCQALADDLRRWLDGEAIQARQATWRERVVRWARRNPAVAALTALVFVLLLVGTTVATLLALHADEERAAATRAAHAEAVAAANAQDEADRADRERDMARKAEAKAIQSAKEEASARSRAEAETRRADETAHALQLDLASRHLHRGELFRAGDLLRGVPDRLRDTWEHRHVLDYLRRRSPLRRGIAAKGILTCVAWSPDGKRLYVGNDNDILVVDAQSVKRLHTLKGHMAPVQSLALSKDGRRLVSGSDDKTVRVWDLTTHKQARVIEGHRDKVKVVSISPKGDRVVSGSDDKSIRVWDADTGKPIALLAETNYSILDVAFHPDGTRIAGSGIDLGVCLWSGEKGQTKQQLKVASGRPHGKIQISPNGRYLAVLWRNQVILWDIEAQKIHRVLTGSGLFLSSHCFSPDSQRVAVGSDNSTVQVWDVATGEERFVVRGHFGVVRGIAFHPDGKQLVSVSNDGMMQWWDLDVRQERLTIPGDSLHQSDWSREGGPLVAYSDGPTGRKVLHVLHAEVGREIWSFDLGRGGFGSPWALSPDGSLLALIGSFPRVLQVNRLTNRTSAFSAPMPAATFARPRFSADGKRLLVVGSSMLHVIDLAKGKELLSVPAYNPGSNDLAARGDGLRVLVPGADKKLRMYDAESGKVVWTAPDSLPHYYRCDFSPDGQRVVSLGMRPASSNRRTPDTAKVWDANSGKLLLELEGELQKPGAILFSPDGRMIAGIDAQTVVLWDSHSGKRSWTLKGHTGQVMSLAYFPDGKRLVTGSADGTIRLWDTTTGREKLTFDRQASRIDRVGVSADGQRILSRSVDGVIRVWHAPPLATKGLK